MDPRPSGGGGSLRRLHRGKHPLAGLSREDFESRLRAALAGRVTEAWIFGSYVSGAFGPDSDIDLMLVTATDAPFQARAFAFEDLLDLGPRFDILSTPPRNSPA